MEIITTKEAAKLLHQHPTTLQIAAKRGDYPSSVVTMHGRIWLWNKEKLLAHIFKES